MMELTEFQQKIQALADDIVLRFYEPMSTHTSFRIGGAAEVMAFPKDTEELAKLLKLSALLDCKTAILGAGTNVLAPDEGVSGLVICLKDCMDGKELLDADRIRVYAGVTMTRAAVFAAQNGLGGLEFAHGIPGSVGGGEIAQVCESVDIMMPDGNMQTVMAEDMDFSYRHSRLEDQPGIVVSAVFRLSPKPVDEIRGAMQELMKRRSASQPLDVPSAGSAFKRPATGYAAAMIDEAGLRGYRVGNAAISQKHAGFAVNLGGATAKDVRKLLADVSDRVFDNTGVRLEPEIRIW